jgi:hypothetical protein
MLGAALDINAARPAPWWQAPSYEALEAVTGTSRFPALIASFRTGRYAITARPALSIPSDTAGALSLMEGVGFPAVFSFTRASAATHVDAAGRLQVAGADVPRLDFSNGRRQLLLEGAATNSVAASEMTGFVAGRRYHDGVGNTGVPPTGMSFNFGGGCTGHCDLLSSTIDARGRRRLRLEFNIVNNTGSTQYPRFRFAEVPASAAEVWSASAFYNVVTTSHAIASMIEATSPTTSTSAVLPTGESQVALHGFVFPAGGQTAIRHQLGISLAHGETWTAIVEVACPQLEKSPRCTSYIPTTGAAAARAADNCQFGAKALALINRGEVGVAVRGQGLWGSTGRLVGGSSQARILGINGTQSQIGSGYASFLTSLSIATPLAAFGAALSFGAFGRSMSFNGSAVSTTSTVMDVTPFTAAFLGRDSTSTGFANGWYDELVLYPFRIADAALPQMALPVSG